jgi:hypothetical protein
VPKRSNLFQDVVAIIYEHLAGDASKQESAMLPNRLTGEMREVDVVLRSKTAGHETVIAIEAASRSRRATVDWVEQMIGKHKNLPTDKVVLVAEAGFSKQARKLATAEQMDPLTPANVAGDDPAYEIVNSIPSLWPKTLQLIPESARVWVTRADGKLVWFKAPANLDLLLDDGVVRFDLVTFVKHTHSANLPQIFDQLGLAQIDADLDARFVIQVGPPVTIGIDDAPRQLFVRWEGPEGHELQPIHRIAIDGEAVIRVSEIKLEHRRLGEIDVSYAFGEGMVGGRPALVVASEGEHGSMLTVRVRDDDE